MSNYSAIRDQHIALLEAVSGIGKVYGYRRLATSEAEFKSLFVLNGVLNYACVFQGASSEETDGPLGSTDEAEEILATGKDEDWNIELFYAHNDTGVLATTSETLFSELGEAIENKYRFLQNLGISATVWKSFPLQRNANGLYKFFGGETFCHYCLWTVKIQLRIVNP